MNVLDLTLATPAENLALDEALLESAEGAGRPTEVLRLWQSPQPIVVVGRSSRVDAEVMREDCDRLGIPILRRTSGGAAIVAGPGCLMYAVVLSYDRRPALRVIEQAHRFVLNTLIRSIEGLVSDVRHQGTSDLTFGRRKFSGNSLRCKRNHLLYHGTLLYDFPLSQMETCLKTPPRQPQYREDRGHSQFLTNLPVEQSMLRNAICVGWQATQPYEHWPKDLTMQLATERYSDPAWNLRR